MKPNEELFYFETWIDFNDTPESRSGKIYKKEQMIQTRIKHLPPIIKYKVYKARVTWEEYDA